VTVALQIEADDVRARLLRSLPSFEPVLASLLDDWRGDVPGVCLELAEFGRHVAGLVASGAIDDAEAGLAELEELMARGTAFVVDVTATCGLEAFDSAAASAGVAPAERGRLLPARSKQFLVASSTPGYYDAGD
jgi:hypothetical protein